VSLPTVTVTASFKSPDGTPAKGRIVFRLVTALVDVSDNILVPATAASVPLDSNGTFSHALVPSDAAGLAPTPVAYEITEVVPGGRHYEVLIPSGNSTVRLSELVPIEAPASMTADRTLTASTSRAVALGLILGA
jgi:hypothetical protein